MGDYPLTAAHESQATTVEGIIQEMLLTRTSERHGRLVELIKSPPTRTIRVAMLRLDPFVRLESPDRFRTPRQQRLISRTPTESKQAQYPA